MHVLIINGSPRTERYSNTDKILQVFTREFDACGVTYECYAVSKRDTWDRIREAYIKNTEILIAMPLFVESAPGILLEFLETLPQKDEATRMSFLLQSGFAEASQLHCGREFLRKLPGYLKLTYGGTLIKGDCFSIRVSDPEQRAKITEPFAPMARLYAKGNGFPEEEVREFAGPEYFTWGTRAVLGIVFKTFARGFFRKVAKEWGCTKPLAYKPYRE